MIRSWLEGFPTSSSIGRNGQHRYNNQDHSMLTGILAVQNLVAGAAHDVWEVNTDPDHHEELGAGDRQVPRAPAAESLEDLIRAGFARYDPVALGGALGILAGVGLFLATAILLLQGGGEARPMLSLLGNYLSSYQVTWTGAWLGLLEAGALGFGAGWLLARTLNAVIAREQRRLEERIERAAAMGLIDGTQ